MDDDGAVGLLLSLSPRFDPRGSNGRVLRSSGMSDSGSAADAQFGDDVGVALLALVAHVAEQPLAATDHLQQSLAGREIVDVVLQVAAETVDPLAQHGDLDLSGTGVGAVGLVGVDQLLLLGGIKRHARQAALTVQTTTLPGQPTPFRHHTDAGPEPCLVVLPILDSIHRLQLLQGGSDFHGFVAQCFQGGDQIEPVQS